MELAFGIESIEYNSIDGDGDDLDDDFDQTADERPVLR